MKPPDYILTLIVWVSHFLWSPNFNARHPQSFRLLRPYLYIYMGQPLQKQVFLAVGLGETFADEPVSHCTQSPNIGLSDLMHGLRIYLFSTDQTFTHQGSTKVSHCCLGDINWGSDFMSDIWQVCAVSTGSKTTNCCFDRICGIWASHLTIGTPLQVSAKSSWNTGRQGCRCHTNTLLKTWSLIVNCQYSWVCA